MDRRYQVFISSTYTDLVDERREVIQALLEMDMLPAGMEMFPAGNEDQWTLIRQVIDESDYYVVIVGGRYGSTTTEGLSYTEKEYDYAVASGVPVMGFVHAAPDEIPAGKSSLEPDARASLDAFRAKVMSRMVKQFASPTELGSVVSRGLIKLQKDHPRDGWVRGNFAMTSETRTEIAELRAELAELKQQSSVEASQSPVIEGLAQGDDAIDLVLNILGHSTREEHKEEWRRSIYRWRIDLDTTWNQILESVGPSLMNEATQAEFKSALQSYCQRLWDASPETYRPSDLLKVKEFRINPQTVEDVVVQLFAIGVIDHGSKKRAVNDKNNYWALTKSGHDQMMKLRARRR